MLPSFPTRARGSDTPSTLDLVISNNDFVDNILNLSPLGKSDHSVLKIECSLNSKMDKRSKMNFNKGDYDGFRNFIKAEFQSVTAINILDSNHCVEDQWQFVKDSLNDGIKKFIPVIEYSTKNRNT